MIFANHTQPSRWRLAAQSGVVLVLCLIFIALMTQLGLSASADSVLQNRLLANFQETERTRLLAMTTLTSVENWLFDLQGPPPDICIKNCDGLYLHGPGDLPIFPELKNLEWWRSQGHEQGTNPLSGHEPPDANPNSNNKPLWIISLVHKTLPVDNGTEYSLTWYQILARASGQRISAVSVVESMVVRSWPPEPTEGVIDTEVNHCATEVSAKCERVNWRSLR